MGQPYDELLALQQALVKHLADTGIIDTDEFKREVGEFRKQMNLPDEDNPLAFLDDNVVKHGAAAPERAAGKTRKILIVDNVALIRNLIKNALMPHGDYLFVEAEDGREGVELFKRERPDMVLMDIEMGRTSGLEALKEIREVDKKTPVIIMTGNATPEYVSTAVKHGMTDFLAKPLEVDRILNLIGKFLK
ncbi:MAG: response regulator [bacterium]|nr:response regulator [bacterium]